jgi:hypothetical protein
MSPISYHYSLELKNARWGLNAWEQFEKFPYHVVPAIGALSGNPSTSGSRETPTKPLNSSISSDSRGSKVIAGATDATAAVQASSANANEGQERGVEQPAAQHLQGSGQAAEVGDGSEFWS